MGGWLGRVSCHNKVGVRIISVVTMMIKYISETRNVVYASIDGRGTGFQSNEHLFQVKPKQHKNCLFFIKKI